jgi:hypothetical protein
MTFSNIFVLFLILGVWQALINLINPPLSL